MEPRYNGDRDGGRGTPVFERESSAGEYLPRVTTCVTACVTMCLLSVRPSAALADFKGCASECEQSRWRISLLRNKCYK